MKKLLAILALGAVMTACNSGTEDKPATKDTAASENPVMDATKTADSAGKMGADTSHKMPADTMKKEEPRH